MKNAHLSLAALFVVGLGPLAQAQTVPLYNLSILLPLPSSSLNEAVGLGDEGCRRPFLSPELFAHLPPMTLGSRSRNDRYRDLRLVGLRFDPKDEEVRLVFQPLIARSSSGGSASFTGDDAALHLFYRMTLASIVESQRELAASYPELPTNKLGVHPRLGAASERRRLKRLMCRIADLELFKVTFMNVRAGRMLWNFGGFHVVEDASGRRVRGEDVDIVNADEVFNDPGNSNMSVQQVIRSAGSIRGTLRPRAVRGDHLNGVFDVVGDKFPLTSARLLRVQIDRIENPRLNSPKTVDCTSCHATESARHAIEAQHPSLPKSAEAYSLPAGYELDSSISPSVLANTINFRAFGYLDADPSISRRVLHESVEMQAELESVWGGPNSRRPRAETRSRR